MKLLTFILSLCILASTVLPCCFSDHCGELSASGRPMKEQQRKSANDCPPFSTCSLLGTFIIEHFYTKVSHVEKEIVVAYGEQPNVSLPSYSYCLFQPPRCS